MIRYILNRILLLIPVILVVSFIVFGLMELAPGSIVDVFGMEDLSAEQRAELIARYNLDKSMFYRYGLYMLNLLQGDLGVSDITGASVWGMFIDRLPNTLILAFAALIIGAGVAIPMGIIAARRAGSVIDNAVTVFALAGMSMPAFWLGLLLLLLFSLNLGWFPGGRFDAGLRSLILPAICASVMLMANTVRQTRSNMLEVLKADYLRTARAKGVPEEVVIQKHALGNAWIPIITAMGSSLAVQLAGSVVVEQVFAWPGIGRMAAEAVRSRDVTTATGTVIMTAIIYVLVLLVVDILYAFVDPRIKAQYMSTGKKRKRVAAVIGSDVGAPDAEGQADAGAPATASIPASSGKQQGSDAEETALTASTPVAASAPDTQARAEVPVSAEQEKTFVTRTNFAETLKDDLTGADGMLATKRYRKRSQMHEIFHHIRQNKGAMTGLIILGIVVLTFLASYLIDFHSVTDINARLRFHRPSMSEPLLPFGADHFGRDMFLRVIYGTRYTLGIGFGSVALAAIFGVTLGAISGYYGRHVDNVIMRISDVIASIPGMLLGMVIVTVMGQSIQNLILAVAAQSIPVYIRMTRASILTVRNNEFVEAARAIGLSNIRIVFAQVLPNGLSPVIVTISASLGITIVVAASLSYLGFGVPVPHPEWGAMISEGKEFARHAPHLMTFPGAFIMITVLAFNLLGDGLRDALDPKLKK